MAIRIRTLAEDIALIRNGGAPLSDDDNLSFRQVLGWVATAAAEKYRSVLLTVQRSGGEIDPSWYSPIELPLSAAEELRVNRARWLGVVNLPPVMTAGYAPMLKDVVIDYIKPLRSTPQAFAAGAGVGHGQYGKDFGVYSVYAKTLRLSLPINWCEPQHVSFQAIVVPTAEAIIANPDAQMEIPDEWATAIRKEVLELAGVELASNADIVNNGTTGVADRQPLPQTK